MNGNGHRERVVSRRSILIIVQNLPVPLDRRVWQEATTLKAAGFDVAVICPKSKIYYRKYECLEGIDIYRYALPVESGGTLFGYCAEFVYCWLMTLLLACKVYVRRPFQVIQACSQTDTYFALAFLFRLLRVKFVFDHHDLSPELCIAKGHQPGGFIHRFLLLLEKATFLSADLVITMNESYRCVAKRRGGVPDRKLKVVRSGPRRAWARGYKSDPLLKLGRKHLVVFVGQIGVQDGVEYLLRVIVAYRNQFGQDTLFVIIGDGPCQQEMVRIASEMAIDDSVHFTGCLQDPALCTYLATADVCVDPDPWSQFNNLSTMNKIMEYMSFGKPVVAFDLLENRRSAQKAAYYVRPNDVNDFSRGIRRLLEDKDMQERMSQFAIYRFEQDLAWEISEQALLKAYEGLFAGAGKLREHRQNSNAGEMPPGWQSSLWM